MVFIGQVNLGVMQNVPGIQGASPGRDREEPALEGIAQGGDGSRSMFQFPREKGLSEFIDDGVKTVGGSLWPSDEKAHFFLPQRILQKLPARRLEEGRCDSHDLRIIEHVTQDGEGMPRAEVAVAV